MRIAILCSIVLFTSQLFGIELDDERIQERWSAAREYSLSKICYVQNTFCDARHEIGPPGVSHTLAGMEFPWRHPGGRFRDSVTRKFVYPSGVKPKIHKRATYPALPNHIREWSRPAWSWPEGTTFFELHLHPAGHPFELRVLDKVKTGNGFECYEPHIFRPFQSAEDLPFEPQLVSTRTLTIDSGHAHLPFRATGTVHRYANAEVSWVTLIDRPWVDDLGHEWHHAGVDEGWLTPKDYAGWIVGNGRDSCVKCHGSAGSPVDYFDVAGRDWYGFVPGDDGIFSFDPVDRRTVSTRGPHGRGWAWTEN